MSVSENTTQRSCGAILNAGKSPRSSVTGSLSNISSPRRSTVCSNSQAPVRERNTNTLTEKSALTIDGSKSRISHKKQKENATNICYCIDCATLDHVPKSHLQELENQLRILKREVIKQKNDNQLLRRHVLVAKKVVKTEIGVEKEEDFDRLLKRVSADNWKGRQELIFALKKKLRELNEIMECMDSEVVKPSSKKRPAPKQDERTDVFPDERTIYWCLELERQDVWRNAERYKQKVIASRDAMKDKLKALTVRNKELMNEIKGLREKLSETPKTDNEKTMEQLRELENNLKLRLEEKVEHRHKLDDLQQQICRNSKISIEMRVKTNADKLNLIDMETKIKSLMVDEENLQANAEEIKNERYKQLTTMRKKLEDIEQDFGKITLKSEQIPKVIRDGKILIEKLKKLRFKVLVGCKKPHHQNESENGSIGTSEDGNEFNSPTAAMSGDAFYSYEKKLRKYKTMSEKLERKVDDKFRIFYNVTLKAKEEIFTLLRNRFILCKLSADIDILMLREKKFKKTLFHPSKQRLIKRKNSSQQLIEIVDEKKTQLVIRKAECKFLKTTIRRVFTSKEDDWEFLESFLFRNNDQFLKEVSDLKP